MKFSGGGGFGEGGKFSGGVLRVLLELYSLVG